MTYQPPHIVVYNDKKYDLCGDSSEGLPMFDILGIRPRGGTTAGNYFATYKLKDDVLHLDNLLVSYYLEDETVLDFPAIGGVQPKYEYSELYYEGMAYVMPITGQITIARKPLWELPEDVNWLIDYESVLRLTVDKGLVTEVEDFSHRIDVLRSKYDEIKDERTEIWHKRGIPLHAVMFDSHRGDEMSAIFAEMRDIIRKAVSTFYFS